MLSNTKDFSFFVIDKALVFPNLHTLNQTFKTNKQTNKQINWPTNKLKNTTKLKLEISLIQNKQLCIWSDTENYL